MLVSLRYDRETSFMVTIGATLLLAPLLWDHYLATLLLPAAFLAQRGRWWGLALPLLAWLRRHPGHRRMPCRCWPSRARSCRSLVRRPREPAETRRTPSTPPDDRPGLGEPRRVRSSASDRREPAQVVRGASNRTASPTARPARAVVPAGSSSTPVAPRTGITSPRHAGRSARMATTRRSPSASGALDEHGIDGEAHEQHVDAVHGQVEALVGIQRRRCP